ncbi:MULTISPECIES: ComF family protein [unclassified Acinetobacter]|uniref:ComF family protein n=1 Tax=unclassified Acinetobacter TaxID=196816 RepID=UPI00244AC928|nr:MULTISPECIES: ComF family protein [unclassified Acinetobacter]MDH0032813.1 ComF family protein [Acinetobacter sp. GD04021]MDH0888241.1 ComF family protein [Acinetobacter sp. GD03873]MDH1084626.1 ComF family protein [Acinetobacter sp. GD03983]MDH2191562.1 ComF family protein [Acinetobacter sp. GD03645]MDH2205151.1 ComF family protein [Acinetobacter sp. GD03647]
MNIKEINGPWKKGIVLDKHVLKSEYLGDNEYGRPMFDTKRSDIGQALFLLKYRNDWNQIPTLVDALSSAITQNFNEKIGLIVPMPASNNRDRQPVYGLAEGLGQALNIPVFTNILHKTKNGTSLKDLQTREEKESVLANSFSLYDGIRNDGRWNVLLIDDLFDTGATMEAACKVLSSYPKVKDIYVAALTWK